MASYSEEDSMHLHHKSLKDNYYQIAWKDPLFVEDIEPVGSFNYLN